MNMVEAFSSREADVYDAIYSSKDYADEAETFSRLMGGPPASLIEFGCGTGSFSRRFMDLGHDVVGVDPSPHMLSHAQAKGVRVVQAWMHDVSQKTLAKFDAACAPFSVLCYAGASQAGLQQSLRGAIRRLKSGARFVADVTNYAAAVTDLRKHMTRKVACEIDGREALVIRSDERRFEPWSSLLRVNVRCEIAWPDNWEKFESTHIMRLYTPRELISEFESAGFYRCFTASMDNSRTAEGMGISVLPSDWRFLISGQVP